MRLPYHTALVAPLAAFAATTPVQELQERSLSPLIGSVLNTVVSDLKAFSSAAPFCSSFLSIPIKTSTTTVTATATSSVTTTTITGTNTITLSTVTVTVPCTSVSTTTEVNIATITSVTGTNTVTLDPVTITTPATTTITTCVGGNPTKRALPEHPYKRAGASSSTTSTTRTTSRSTTSTLGTSATASRSSTTTSKVSSTTTIAGLPPRLATLASAVLSSACSCLGVPTSTTTQTSTTSTTTTKTVAINIAASQILSPTLTYTSVQTIIVSNLQTHTTTTNIAAVTTIKPTITVQFIFTTTITSCTTSSSGSSSSTCTSLSTQVVVDPSFEKAPVGLANGVWMSSGSGASYVLNTPGGAYDSVQFVDQTAFPGQTTLLMQTLTQLSTTSTYTLQYFYNNQGSPGPGPGSCNSTVMLGSTMLDTFSLDPNNFAYLPRTARFRPSSDSATLTFSLTCSDDSLGADLWLDLVTATTTGCRLGGFEHLLELYQVRRASGRNVISAQTPEERNQTMGHHGNTYEQFYMPNLIERDFQSIYFGTPSQDILVRSVARMGLSRDKRVPIKLNDKQKLEVNKHPRLVRLREKRELCKQEIADRGYHPVATAKGTRLYSRYEETKRKIDNLTNTLRRKRLDQAILDFHDSIDTIEIDKQLNGTAALDTTRAIVQYELRERATITRLLSQPLDELDEAHAKVHSIGIFEQCRNVKILQVPTGG